MDFLKLTTEKLDPTEISELVVHEECGAVAMFAGTTRDNFEGKQVRESEKLIEAHHHHDLFFFHQLFFNHIQGRYTRI